jgi:predicted esterase YcpF (UPF0227 family)
MTGPRPGFFFVPVLIYIHGFNSSPQSHKARVLAQFLQTNRCQVEYLIPHLSDRPDLAITQLQAIIEQYSGQKPVLIGSSLGGYYATWLACRFGLRAVLINPAVRPYDLLVDYLGPNENYYSGEKYTLTTEHMQQLRQLETEPGECYQQLDVYLETGDEVLDYRQAEAKYRDTRLHIFAGGNHAFVNFQRLISDILKGLGISCAND